MAVLLFVVDGRAPLHHLLQFRRVEDFVRTGRPPDLLGQRQRCTAVAVSHADQDLVRIVIERKCLAFDDLGPGKQLVDGRSVERLEHHDTRARQERRDQLERRVFRRRSDQDDGTILDDGQKRVLLHSVEAMDLVDEQQRSPPGLAPRTRRIEDLFEIADPGKNG